MVSLAWQSSLLAKSFNGINRFTKRFCWCKNISASPSTGLHNSSNNNGWLDNARHEGSISISRISIPESSFIATRPMPQTTASEGFLTVEAKHTEDSPITPCDCWVMRSNANCRSAGNVCKYCNKLRKKSARWQACWELTPSLPA